MLYGSNSQTLSQYLFDSADWALVYFDEDSTVFLKNTLENKPLIDKFKIDLRKWQTEKFDLRAIGMKAVSPESYLKRGRILFNLSLYEPSLNECRQALRLP